MSATPVDDDLRRGQVHTCYKVPQSAGKPLGKPWGNPWGQPWDARCL